ncbi:MAG: nuclear transport factor 2 family protein [Chloroflexota bacterium]
MSNVDSVKQMYDAFGRGDVPAILEHLDDNVEWETDSQTQGIPWFEPRHGKAEVPAFFESLAPIEFTTFDPETYFETGDKVFVLIHMEATHRETGKKYSFPYEGHLWVFNKAGKVTKYQHVTDTAKHWQMANGH